MFQRRLIGEILLEQGKITQELLQKAVQIHQETQQRIGEIMVAQGWVTMDELDEAQAIQYEVPYESLTTPIPRDVLEQVPSNIARTYRLIPVKSDEVLLHVAMVEPNDFEAIDWLRVHTKKQIAPRFTPLPKLERALDYYYGIVRDEVDELIETDVQSDRFSLEEAKRASEEPPIVSLVNTILQDAIRMRSSDIHFEPVSNALEIRFRIDGMLRKVRTLPKSMQAALISRVKIMSELDISERRLPQDGRMGLKIKSSKVDMRVSTYPTRHGERIVLRVLDSSKGVKNMFDLGFSEYNLGQLMSMIKRPHGLVLVTGPTGSGKTTTLYACLQELISERLNILTCEDPVEYELDGIGQSQVNERIGLTFATQLRATLRQDPDVILVGEIRDKETAEIACRAAMTGHLVLSTLHTNDAPSCVPRLIDMGIEPFLINSSLRGVIAQRLVRILCDHCKKEVLPRSDETFVFGLPAGSTVFEPVGCDYCNGTGYSGRKAIHEVMVLDDEVQTLVAQKAQAKTIRQAAIRNGMLSMSDDAVDKALNGLTSLDEIRVHVAIEKRFGDGMAA